MRHDDDRAGSAVVTLACIAAAVTADFGQLHALHNADSLIPILVSLERWQPFYWGQDRYGMLLPALAYPFQDPLTNLMVQSGMAIFAGLVSFFFLASVARVPQPWASGFVATVIFLLSCPPHLRFEFLLTEQPYGVSLALGCVGILTWRRGTARARCGSVVLMVLAHWVNIGAWLILTPLVALTICLSKAGTAGVGEIFLVLAGAAMASQLARLSPHSSRLDGLVSMRAWPNGWWLLVLHASSEAGRWVGVSVVAALVGILVSIATGWDSASAYRRAAWSLGMAALGYGLIVGVVEWVGLNHYLARYLLPSFVLAGTAAAALFVAPAARQITRVPSSMIALLLPIGLVGAVTLAFGRPSLRQVRTDVSRVGSVGGWSESLLDAGCTHVAGDYWAVWPAVFHGTERLRERGRPKAALWGVTYRGEEAQVRWRGTSPRGWRICFAPGDPQATYWLRQFGLTDLTPFAQTPRVSILAVR